jgi:hypothetical protein
MLLQNQKKNQLTQKLTRNQQPRRNQLTNLLIQQLQKRRKRNVAPLATANVTNNKNALESEDRNELNDRNFLSSHDTVTPETTVKFIPLEGVVYR